VSGEHPVEHDRVVIAVRCGEEAVGAGVLKRDGVACVLEAAAEDVTEAFVVLDHKHSHAAILPTGLVAESAS
jgi:hypothetical protein